MDNPWIEWGGGECPVPKGTYIDVQYRDGNGETHIPALETCFGAGPGYWRHEDHPCDIIAYRLHTPPAVKLTADDDAWVGITRDIAHAVFRSAHDVDRKRELEHLLLEFGTALLSERAKRAGQ